MLVFENCSVFLELRNLSLSEKKKLRSAVTENGGSITFIITAQCSLVVVSDVSQLSSTRLRSVQRHQVPVVSPEYLHRCLESGQLLSVDGFKLDTSSPHSVVPAPPPPRQAPPTEQDLQVVERMDMTTTMGVKILGKFRVYSISDSDVPEFPENFNVAKYSFYSKRAQAEPCCVLELHSCRASATQTYRVLTQWRGGATGKCDMVFPSTSEEALQLYVKMSQALVSSGLQRHLHSSEDLDLDLDLGSSTLHQLLLEEKLTHSVPQKEVCVLVETLWTEALGCLDAVLSVPIHTLSLSDVSRAEGLLLQAQRKLGGGDVMALLAEFYSLVPHRAPPAGASTKLLSEKLDLCQVIRDVLSLSETAWRSPSPSSFSLGKFRALRCSMEPLPVDSSEYQAVVNLLDLREVQVQQIVLVARGSELQTFRSDIGNIKPLLHSSSPRNFVGILSRGLLLPRVAEEAHGIQRTDVGKLGAGIYFSADMRASLQYSSPSSTDGSRLMLVCDVALGESMKVFREDVTRTKAPDGFHSVIGMKGPNTNATPHFQDDEYVVYSPDQVKLKYLVQFLTHGDKWKDFNPDINMSVETISPGEPFQEDSGLNPTNPLDSVASGLLDSSGQQLPLEAVHVKCKLMDLLGQVIIFQKYTNHSAVPIEAKYVFPLEDSAAVCGFEAFINGKHVVGKVKEKEAARREYRQAVQSGHGAYLMDQEAADVFTISVGNLPPAASVLIKVTFVCELVVCRSGSILFSLPGSVAPWQETAALNQNTQDTVKKLHVSAESASTREFSLDMSVEMPCVVSSLQCITHKVKMKRTDCKAVLSVLPGAVLGPDGFQLSITLSDVHLPRMWVEKHPEKDSQACMLVFYPDFESSSSADSSEVVLLLDVSQSMRGEPLRTAQRVALLVLNNLHHNTRVNVIQFSTVYREAFLTTRPIAEARQKAERFIRHPVLSLDSTELWRPLRALSLLPLSRGVRNLLLLSDGHIQSSELTLRLVRENQRHSRLFCCGLSPTANRHMLRALAQAGGGACEFFDTKAEHNWKEKVSAQVERMASVGCSSVSVKWQQFNSEAAPPLQAPSALQALFNDSHTLVYGFVPHCTQATLTGNLGGQELETMVSTTELQKSTGTFLHKLTARALIRDYEDGNLDISEAEHEGKKAELRSFIVELSKEFSILSQFTSFVAVEERDPERVEELFTDILQLVAAEDVDFLPYISWIPPLGEEEEEEEEAEIHETSDSDDDFGLDVSFYSNCSVKSQFSPFLHEPKMRSHSLSIRKPSEDLRLSDQCREDESESLGSSIRDPGEDYIAPPLLMAESLAVFEAPEEDVDMDYDDTTLLFPTEDHSNSHLEVSNAISTTESSIRRTRRKLKDLGVLHSAAPPASPPRLLPQSSSCNILQKCSFDSSVTSSIDQDFADPPSPTWVSIGSGKAFGGILPPPCPPLGGAPPPPPPTGFSFGSGRGFGSALAPPCPPFGSALAPPCFPFGGAPLPPPPTGFSFGSGEGFGSALPLSTPGLLFGATPPPPPPTGFSFGSGEGFGSALPLSTPGLLFGATPPPLPPTGFSFGSGEGFGSALPLSTPGLLFGATPPPLPPTSKSLPQRLRSVSEFFRQSNAYQPMSVNSPLTKTRLSCKQVDQKETVVELQGSESPKAIQFDGVEKTAFIRARRNCLKTSFRGLRAKQECVRNVVMDVSAESASAASELKWTKIFQMQNSEGFWDFTSALGQLININVELLTNDFLTKKGIYSLGLKARTDILRLLATLLVLQLMKLEELEEGKLLRGLFSLKEATEPSRVERWEVVKKAADWVRWADWQYPSIYSRLELALSWEAFTRQLLGYEDVPPFSELRGLHLQLVPPPLLVH
ncbi:protein mono-ADP-ribosyltransferase PARP4 isoform X2 [Gouania willdenowi]|uniref:protein mono-ADP-ribosyltransferase PARP4 isoform X2 n=1 Tax=Gouania willdenowi TaxID=441366 RepID=UPI001054A44A|nr:protein mono-ADP-ribosyltransferase PARP4 isoform X2 [Gouania willdenowi]